MLNEMKNPLQQKAETPNLWMPRSTQHFTGFFLIDTVLVLYHNIAVTTAYKKLRYIAPTIVI
jgi:hypothetical protein